MLIPVLKRKMPTGIKINVQQHAAPNTSSSSPIGKRRQIHKSDFKNAPVILNAIPTKILIIIKQISNVIISTYLSGITIAATIYARIPVPAQNTSRSHINLTIVGSILKYSAIPPHTPHNFLSSLFFNLFIVLSLYLSFFLS